MEGLNGLNGFQLNHQRRRALDKPLWYQVLRDFGLPTLGCIALAVMLCRMVSWQRQDAKDDHAAMVEAMRDVGKQIKGVGDQLRETNGHLTALEHKR